jgi:ABC-2 type transport system ATP-binding protein
MAEPGAITCRGLVKQFGKRVALAGIDLDVRAGEIVGYLGPNGAGKTTTLRLLVGAIRPTAGTATIRGKDCWSQSRGTLATTGFLPSDPELDPRADGRSVLRDAAALRGIAHRSAWPAQSSLAERLNLDPARRVGELSRGNRQKLAVILALWHKPSVLLLDEPTTGLDPIVQQTLHELIVESTMDGAAVLLSSHVLGEVERYTHRVVVLRDGTVVAADAIEALRRRAPSHVRARVANPGALSRLEGIRNLVTTGDTVSFSVERAGLDAVVKALSTTTVSDLTVREADLDEVFFSLYDGQPR